MYVPSDVVYNFLVELKKKDIDPIDRAKIILHYCREKNLSIRGLADELGMPHSTLQDWIDYDKIDKRAYIRLVNAGVSKQSIHRILRNNRSRHDISIIMSNDLNLRLEESMSLLRNFLNDPVANDDTIRLINELRNMLNRIELHIERGGV